MKAPGDLHLRRVGGRVVDLAAEIDANASLMQEIWGERRRIAEAEHMVVGLRVVAAGDQRRSTHADVRKMIDVGRVADKRDVLGAELNVHAGVSDPQTLGRGNVRNGGDGVAGRGPG